MVWSFDFISIDNLLTEKEFNIDHMYDPVKDAASQNSAGPSNSNGPSQPQGGGNDGGSSQPQGGGNGGPSQPQGSGSGGTSQAQGGGITDTRRLADHLSQYRGGVIWNARIETYDDIFVSPEDKDFNRIWVNVKTEHPEFIQNHRFGSQKITKTLLNQIYSLNKNYPR